MIIAIDGPAAAGKGTLARRLAAHFGLAHLDTGLLYRAVGRRVLDADADPADPAAAAAAAGALTPADLDRADLRGPVADAAAALVAAIPSVRAALLEFQRSFGRQPGGAVLDGRDIGTVIFPDADAKFWVTASATARGHRRWRELVAAGARADEAAVTAEIRARDARDAARLVPAADAVRLDTTTLDADETFARALAILARSPAVAGEAGMPCASPLLAAKDYAAASVFRPENLLRESRRQKGLPDGAVPQICLLDPDGDLLAYLRRDGRAQRSEVWACYHSELHVAEHDGERWGVVGGAVGAAFAVLVAEQLFASGCRALFSVTSAGLIDLSVIGADPAAPVFILIERALRDEGTSLHYLPPRAFAEAPASLLTAVGAAFDAVGLAVRRGATWTTDAPFRETDAAIAAARRHGVLAVEMEAAALYAFAEACARPVLCLAHVTNRMAQEHGDFEKGEANGARAVLALLGVAARAWRGMVPIPPEINA